MTVWTSPVTLQSNVVAHMVMMSHAQSLGNHNYLQSVTECEKIQFSLLSYYHSRVTERLG